MAETEIKKINGRTVCDQTARDSIPKTASDIGAESAGTAATKITSHNTSSTAHNDIRVKLQSLVNQLNSFLNVDDETRNELSEVLDLIDANKDLIEEITTKKVNVADIIDNLVTNASNQPLSAAQGVVLKELIDALQTAINNINMPTKTSQLQDDVGFAKQTDVDNLSQEIVHYITPEMYGAVGDGVTDDSVAIQTAIDTAGNTYPVYLAKKNYKISSGLVLRTNYTTFHCEGTITYDGTDSAITLTNIIRSKVYVSAIYATNGTAVRLSNRDGYVKFNDVRIDNIRESKVGIHLTTPNTENLAPIYYNKLSYMEIVATEIGVHSDPIGYYINENRYYGGTIGGDCFYGIKLGNSNVAYSTGANKFLSGGIEGVSDDGYGIHITDSSYNIIYNIRNLERYGDKFLCFKGMSMFNEIKLPMINLSEIDISELGNIGINKNIVSVMTSSFDGSTKTGEQIEITKTYGIVYDVKASTNTDYVKVSLTNFPDNVIKPIEGRIYTSLYSSVYSVNGNTFTLDPIYYGASSKIKGEPITIKFGEGSGRIKLVDNEGTVIIDNTTGKFDSKSISIRWGGYDKYTNRNLWNISVEGQYGLDGYTPQKGTDYFTTADIQDIVDAVYAKVADGNEVAY